MMLLTNITSTVTAAAAVSVFICLSSPLFQVRRGFLRVEIEKYCSMYFIVQMPFCLPAGSIGALICNIYSKYVFHPHSSGGIVFSTVCVFVCLSVSAVTPEPLEISQNFLGIIVWLKGRTSSMGMQVV